MFGKYAVISILGEHAGENVEAILARKREDIRKTGFSIWVINSSGARVEKVKEAGEASLRENSNLSCLFISPSSPKGAKPTITTSKATEYSVDGEVFERIPEGLSPITGRMGKTTCGLFLGSLESHNLPEKIDLWHYAGMGSGKQAIFSLGNSTGCFVRTERPSSEGLKSRFRNVVAHGTLKKPFAVYLK